MVTAQIPGVPLGQRIAAGSVGVANVVGKSTLPVNNRAMRAYGVAGIAACSGNDDKAIVLAVGCAVISDFGATEVVVTDPAHVIRAAISAGDYGIPPHVLNG